MATHATDIAELRQRIARHPDRPTLKACSLVCKAWYLDFHSVLWEHFTYELPKRCANSPEEQAAWLDIISKKAHLFRHIHHGNFRKDIVPELRDILLDRCHDLITIEAYIADVKPRTPICYWRDTLRPLIEQNKISLRRLRLREVISIPSMTSLHLPSLIAGLSRLQSLELGMSSTLEDLLSVLEACPTSLECFGLRADVRRKQGYLNYSNSHHSLSLVHQAAATAPSLRLKHLNAIPPQQLRNVHLTAMDIECASMLVQKHHQSLESLVAEFVRGHTRALGDILARCCNLKYLKFEAKPVDSRVLVDPQRPWVCSELEVFEGYFGLSPSLPPPPIISNQGHDTGRSSQEDDGKVATTDQVESLFMQRVGQLTKLRRLVQSTDLEYFFSDYPLDMEADAMTWTLSSGLRHLADLVNLEWLELDGYLWAGFGIPELMFIKQHWHSLQGLACCYSIDADEVLKWLAIEWPELKVELKHRL
ncbi:hypothetical protein BGX34_001271 [Mortierella sp. NVP85]|nr:hypothetical protein BGX34_001271 [Mortierella sp. NVP85]